MYSLLRLFYGFIKLCLNRNGLVLEFYYFRIRYLRQPQKPYKSLRADSKIKPKPHILMLAEKWDAHNPDIGPSQMNWIFFGSLDASGLITYDRLNHDEFRNQNCFDKEVLIKCLQKRPDFIFITSWLLSPLNIETLKLIRGKLGIPVVVVWGDLENHLEEAEALVPFIDYGLTLSKVTMILKQLKEPMKYLRLWTALDPKIYYRGNLNREIDVSFLGTMKDHPDRRAGISALRRNGINVYQSGGQRENRLSIDKYADVYRRSKIALNFCYHPNGIAQVKGRVFEVTSCGAMLLEAENNETAQFFDPMVDYVPFSDEKDLVDKIRYYLAHDDEREEITANGHKKVNEKYNPEIFWQTVIEKVLQ